MLTLHQLKKVYELATAKQTVLNNINLSFRKKEFVAILGPSGSGKTTLLTIIGGLDSYTDGDLLINGHSTKNFKEEDWDAYRNNSVGFIFQNYHLIPHLTVLENVEMGMKLSGVNQSERREKAREALIKVGLEDHITKKPNQLSGGQMQRVAIARAIVNDPDIILADEPTGALDSATSIQVMELIKELAKEKLVIMVTHNAELASTYANRIIQLKDGELLEDTHPFSEDEMDSTYRLQHTSMSFLTALKSSGKNILSKKWRTLLTSIASSVGIIGVALVLSIANGFSKQMEQFQTEMLSSLPITITNGVSIDFTKQPIRKQIREEFDSDQLYITTPEEENPFFTNENELTSEYLDYIYQLDPTLINHFTLSRSVELPILHKLDGKAKKLNGPNVHLTTYPFKEKENLSSYLQANYDLLAGAFPTKETDLVLLVDSYNQLDSLMASELGLTNKKIDVFSLVNKEFKLVFNDDYYVQEEDLFTVNGNPTDLTPMYENNHQLTLPLAGIIRTKMGVKTQESPGLLYSDQLNERFIENARNSEIVQWQQEVDYHVVTGDFLMDEEFLPDNFSFPGGMGFSSVTIPTKRSVLGSLGGIEMPDSISISPVTFEGKDQITNYLDAWNETNNNKITYLDMAEMVSNSLNTFIKSISYILIAFTSISLLVSMIMIGIIIYISVLERTKEIGILRALGARKKDITRLFNAETFIIGATSGILGIVLTYLLSIPINKIINHLTHFSTICSLRPLHAIGLILLSIVLTMIGGYLPAKMAAKKDPVEALRQ